MVFFCNGLVGLRLDVQLVEELSFHPAPVLAAVLVQEPEVAALEALGVEGCFFIFSGNEGFFFSLFGGGSGGGH